MSRRIWTLLVWLALTLAAMAVVFFPVWDPGQQDVAGLFDTYRQFIPANFFFDASLHAGDFPTWNPLTLSGMPHAADPQVWAFYPPNLARAVVNFDPTPGSTAFGLTVLMALHLVVFAGGTYLLARRHGLSRAASALATMGVLFSALVVRRAAEFHFVFTLAWLPWILLLWRRMVEATENKAKIRWAVVLGLVMGMATLGGSPQLLPQIAVAALAYGIAILPLAGSGSWPARARVGGRELSFALIALVIAVGIAACSVLPAAQLLEVSGRAGGAETVEGHTPEAWNWSYAWQSITVYPGRIYEPETVRGAGVALLALAITGLLLRARRALPFVAMVYVLFDLVLGPPMPLSLLVTWLTPFEMVSATRAADVAVLPLAVLAGYGLDSLVDSRKRTRVAAAVVAVVVGACALWTLVARLAGIWLEPSRWVIYAPALAVAVMIVVALVPRHRAALLALVPLLVFAEVWAWNRSYVPELTVRAGHDAQLEEFLQNRPAELWQGNGRGTIGLYNYNLYRLEPAINGYNPLHIERVRKVLAGPERGREYRRAVRQTEIPARNARGHQFMKRSFWLADTAVPGPLPAPERWFAPSRYAYLPDGVPEGFPTLRPDEVPDQPYSDTAEMLPLAPPESKQVSRDRRGERFARYSGVGPVELPPRHAVLEVAYRAVAPAELRPYFETPDAPRLLPGLRVLLGETGNADRAVRIPLPDMSSVLIGLETRLRGSDPPPEIVGMRIVVDDADENERIEVVSRSADRVEVALRGLPAQRLLVFLDPDFPGWEATVDGEAVPIYRAQDAFKSVVVPAGDHTVEFQFSSRRVHIGVAVSLLTWIAAGAALFILGRPASHARARERVG